MTTWPNDQRHLEELQRRLAEVRQHQPPWRPPSDRPVRVAGVFVASAAPMQQQPVAGEPAWAAAAVLVDGECVESAVIQGVLDAPYAPGLLALREGALLEQTVQQLRQTPDILVVNATGLDHPRRAGLAIHLGAACGLPTVGVTDRTLVASGPEPEPHRGAVAELRLEGTLVGYRLRTQAGVRPIVVHAGWRVGAQIACALVLRVSGTSRTPAPLRAARRLARTARAEAQAAADPPSAT